MLSPMDKTKRILIADDHSLMREGLRQLVETHINWVVVGEASDGADAISQIQAKEPDLLLIDLSLPDLSGMQVIEAARILKPAMRILVVTAHCASSYVFSALQAGAHGYLVKTEESREILRAIESVLAGYAYLSPEVTGEVTRGYVEGTVSPGDDGILSDLTPRERDIVGLILKGMVTNNELAQRLFVAVKTVQKHKTNLFRKQIGRAHV